MLDISNKFTSKPHQSIPYTVFFGCNITKSLKKVTETFSSVCPCHTL